MAKQEAKTAEKTVYETAEYPLPVKAQPAQSVYDAKALIGAYQAMGYPKECVAAALKYAKVEKATFDEAKNTVKKFMERVIK